MSPVRFHYEGISGISVLKKEKIKKFIVYIFESEGKGLEKLDYIFCTDRRILQINQDFLNHDYYTDIITFDLSAGQSTIGEVYISVETVKYNAAKYGCKNATELLRVIFHGSLHLCGYKDKTKSEITIMREKEEYYLQSFLLKH